MVRRILHTKFTALLLLLTALFFVSCSKTIDRPAAVVPREVANFHISESRLILLEGNANSRAAVFSWAAGKPEDTYTIEADLSTDFFADPVELITTKSNSVSFTAGEFNTLMSKLLYGENTGKVDFRVRVNGSFGHPVYSAPTAMIVTTYRKYIVYDDASTMKVPGNFQGWNVSTAPKIVAAKTPGEYEGYLNFSNPSPQILLVKGDQNKWDPKNTFYYIGADMFGFGGSIMMVNGGPGVYLVKASTNSNKWSYTKISNWGIAGTAVKANSQTSMNMVDESLSWSVTTELGKGSFRIRANGNNAISFGHKATDQPGQPSYDGGDFEIKKEGNYTVTVTLSFAGNYAYSIHRNS